ncbi:2-hydroxychromene-2-carboxylate isomerase [Pendulispora albinea]|uniref:2-hydroxychromene-2-carboxylate isomerase n=1 Tax=Pendulispora albinea TaxID=2741071 RepID=A0ABZ2M545_9BACT
MAAPIRFLFDVVSPYAYLAWTQLPAIAERHGRSIDPVPVLFAGLLRAHGTRGPAEVPARRDYVVKDIQRIAHRFGVPIDLPPAHPFNPLRALRTASIPIPHPTPRIALVDAIFSAVWRLGRNVEDPQVIEEIGATVGLDPAVIAEASSDETKARLRTQTDEAIELGVFGVPTMLVDGEMFWGCDSLPHLDTFLGGTNPVSAEFCERWRTLGSTAQRA